MNLSRELSGLALAGLASLSSCSSRQLPEASASLPQPTVHVEQVSGEFRDSPDTDQDEDRSFNGQDIGIASSEDAGQIQQSPPEGQEDGSQVTTGIAGSILRAAGVVAATTEPRDAPKPPTVSTTAQLSAGIPGQLSEGQVRQLLADVGTPPEWIDSFVRIATCESKNSPDAVGDNGNSVGLYQIGRSRPGWAGWFLYFGIPETLALDPLVNTRVAMAIARYSVARGQSPFSQWTCAG